MRIIILASFTESLINFRGPLLNALIQRGHEVIASAPGKDKDIINRLHLMGVKYRSIELERTGLNPYKDLKAFVQLVNLFRQFKPDIVLSYTIKPVIYGSLAASTTKVPHIYSIITGLGYTFSVENFKQRFVNIFVCYLYRIALIFNRSVFFQNPDDLSLFYKKKLLRNINQAVLINGSGVDLEYFKTVPVQEKPQIFLLIARLLRAKGIIEYVKAASILKQRYPYVIFRLLGPFEDNPLAIRKEQIEKWQKEMIIEYLGETKDVRPFIKECSVYVLPSYYREGTPRTILEAMAMGRPIVTTDAPGCRETVREGENGFLVLVKDVDSLAKAMERFIVEPELIRKMGKRSREIAVEKYDVHKVNAVIIKTMGLNNEKIV